MNHNNCRITVPEIPVFFSTDDNYIPFLDVALSSLIENASRDYRYRIMILNTGLSAKNMARILEREQAGFAIEFVDISDRLEGIMSHFRNVYHFSIVTYYRLFIASLFPRLDKIVYLDCDLVVTGDISKLYFTDMEDAIIAAAPEQYVRNTPAFRLYAEKALGVDPDGYVNAGVLVMDLRQFRRHRIEERFVDLITHYDFDLLDPDQAYLNYLCDGYIHSLPTGWNMEPTDLPVEGELSIVHYALYKKPWQFDDVKYGEYFWRYAASSPFYGEILRRRESFTEEQRAEKERTATEILSHAMAIVASDNTFTTIQDKEYSYGKVTA